jgi:ankyrin repeat protein
MLMVSCIVTMSYNQNLKLMNRELKKEDLDKTKMDTGKYFTAVRNGDVTTVRNQLKNNIDINSKDADNETAIIIATERNDVAMVNLLLEHKANINIASDKIDNTPIMIASVKGYRDIVQLLIEKSNPDMTILNGYGGTALIPACERGHVEVVKLLLEKTNVKVNHINKPGWTAMLEAIVLSNGGKSQQEIVRLLLAHGADKNIADKNGITPLEHAKKKGFKELVDILSN